ncbi:MAG: hypothetical protein EXS37_08755 [Opitutus sp.]|nr:hypothetical protein [Opitutus sp.]
MSTLTAIRDDYIFRFRPRARAEAAHFALGSPVERVRKAALARTASNRKHKHQWRIPPAVLEKFAARLITQLGEIARARSFAHLLAIVDAANLKGVSKLTVYDTAVRIGAGQRIEPDEVYLHADTRKGAARLGWNVRRPSIPLSEIPPALAGLSASEIEDLLCSYAGYFGPGAKKFLPTGCGGESPPGCEPERSRHEGCP